MCHRIIIVCSPPGTFLMDKLIKLVVLCFLVVFEYVLYKFPSRKSLSWLLRKSFCNSLSSWSDFHAYNVKLNYGNMSPFLLSLNTKRLLKYEIILITFINAFSISSLSYFCFSIALFSDEWETSTVNGMFSETFRFRLVAFNVRYSFCNKSRFYYKHKVIWSLSLKYSDVKTVCNSKTVLPWSLVWCGADDVFWMHLIVIQSFCFYLKCVNCDGFLLWQNLIVHRQFLLLLIHFHFYSYVSLHCFFYCHPFVGLLGRDFPHSKRFWCYHSSNALFAWMVFPYYSNETFLALHVE